ncbi:MAG: hypothetical protein LC126_05480 [Bryobacterales bacterium]|nr:hypothetical protein [Bryobacterales bacterium]
MRLFSQRSLFTVTFVGLVCGCGAANAKDIYIAQSAAGSNTGTSCANAYAVSFFNTTSNWGSGSGQIGPGTIVHLCGTITTGLVARGSGVSGSPVTIFFEAGSKLSLGSCGSTGCLNISTRGYIIVDGGTNGVIEATNSGTGLGNSDSVGVYARSGTNHSEIRNLTINNMYVHTGVSDTSGGRYTAIWFDGSNNLIHHNIIKDTMCGICGEQPNSDNHIYNNVIHNINWGIFLSGGNITDGVTRDKIYGNEVYDFTNWDTTADAYHHDGIFVSGNDLSSMGVSYIDIFNNYLHGTISQCCTTAYIYTNNHNHVRIFNNLVVAPSNGYVNNGLITVGAPGYPDTNDAVLNNTVIGGTTVGSGGACYYIKSQSQFDFINNIASTCTYLLWTTAGDITYTTLNNNVYQASHLTGVWRIGNTYYSTLTAWRAASTGDADSLATTAGLDLDFTYKPLLTSVAVHAGMNLTSSNITALNSDKAGILRPGIGASWDAGAYTFAALPSSPTGLLVTVVQ